MDLYNIIYINQKEMIMKTKLFFIFSIVLMVSGVSFAQQAPEISVEDLEVCTSIEDRVPVGVDTSFSGDVEKLYCFTKIVSNQNEGSIYHVWVYNDRVMSRIELPTKAKVWRTWSSKRILPSWTGKWRVDIEAPDGTILGSKEFEIK
jgi:hypothetical protein